MLIAAIDQRTTSTRCLLVDEAGNATNVGAIRHRQILPRDGWVEHDAAELLANIRELLARVADAGSPADGVEKEKPDHFIYVGLKGELDRLRKVAEAGGWPAIPPGRSIAPGTRDPRLPPSRPRGRPRSSTLFSSIATSPSRSATCASRAAVASRDNAAVSDPFPGGSGTTAGFVCPAAAGGLGLDA